MKVKNLILVCIAFVCFLFVLKVGSSNDKFKMASSSSDDDSAIAYRDKKQYSSEELTISLLEKINIKDQFEIILDISGNENEYLEKIRKYIDLDKIIEGKIVPIYMKNFTINELNEAIKFYEGPVGKKFLKNMNRNRKAITLELMAQFVQSKNLGRNVGNEENIRSIYARYLTPNEVEQVMNFSKTPTGRKIDQVTHQCGQLFLSEAVWQAFNNIAEIEDEEQRQRQSEKCCCKHYISVRTDGVFYWDYIKKERYDYKDRATCAEHPDGSCVDESYCENQIIEKQHELEEKRRQERIERCIERRCRPRYRACYRRTRHLDFFDDYEMVMNNYKECVGELRECEYECVKREN